ncbi:MAG TPA: NAD-dependent malic enzyme [Gemmatimonadales bacterium]
MAFAPETGIRLLQDPRHNKGTAFTEAERDALGIRGLLPPRVFTLEEQLERVMENFRAKDSAIERYVFMVALQDRNETLFYRTVMDHLTDMLPVIYTPTVGDACQRFGHIYRRPRGLYVTARDRGRVRQVLANWPDRAVAVIVVTDGQRILGLGDLGAYGMGIPIGKVALYTACAGIHPWRCLPVMLDVGTDNPELLRDPLYTGIPQRRLRGEEYAGFVEEFVEAVGQVFPGALLQFEDFATENAVALLTRYRDRICTFNDDMQGTAAVALAALLASERRSGRRLTDERVLFVGAGSAACGIAGLLAAALRARGVPEDVCTDRIWMFDAGGLLTAARTDVAPYARPYARAKPAPGGLEGAVTALRPTTLIGVSGQPKLFTEPVLRALAAATPAPMVLALSNPTSRAECTAEDAYRWTGGTALYGSGSPFTAVQVDGRRYEPSQANNAYIFPGVGLGVTAAGITRITDRMFLAAAEALAGLATEGRLDQGTLFPPLSAIRDVSVAVGAAVARAAADEGLVTRELPPDLEAHLRAAMYQPRYRSYLPEAP